MGAHTSQRRRQPTEAEVSPGARTKETETPLGTEQELALRSRSIDFAILCERFRPNRVGFDPRVSPEAIAARLNVNSARVRRRLAEWRSRKFFLGYDLLPHPELIHVRYAYRRLEFRDTVSRDRAFEDLALLDGVVQITPAHAQLRVFYAVESPAGADRRSRQIARIEGLTAMSPQMDWLLPPCFRKMSHADWMLLRALRRHPEAKLVDLALEVGQSTRTTSRRWESLFVDSAVIFDPIFDYSRFPGCIAFLLAEVDPPERSEDVIRQVSRLDADSLPCWGPMVPAPGEPATRLRFMIGTTTAVELDELCSRATLIPGVARCEVFYGQPTRPIRWWLDERLDEMVATSARSAS